VVPTFTVVCVYNSKLTLEKYLTPGLARQTMPFELRLVDNTTQRFGSAASALNHGAKDATGDYLVFVHQDVELLSPTFFQEAARQVQAQPNLGIAGVVGASEVNGALSLVGRCLQGDADPTHFELDFTGPRPAQTLDEQLLVIPRSRFQVAGFDPIVCPGWDLYGVEYAVRAAKLALDVMVLPLRVRHASWGKLRWSYFQSLTLVQRKHPDVAMLPTTCGLWPRWPSVSWPQEPSAAAHWVRHKWRAGRAHLKKRWTEIAS
jgi:hypothetical protein